MVKKPFSLRNLIPTRFWWRVTASGLSGLSARFTDFVSRNWASIVAVALVLAYVWPSSYRWVIGLLPKSYYHAGLISRAGNGLEIDRSVDLKVLDDHPSQVSLARIRATKSVVARLPEGSYKPGREGPRSSTDELFGRQWNGGSCLYVSKIVLSPSMRTASGARVKSDRPDDVHDKLFNEAPGKSGPTYTYSIWLHGTPLPCSLF